MAAATPPTFGHEPVMRDEIVTAFAAVPAGTIVDATVGGGGHSEALLSAREDLDILAIDRDPAALDAARRKLERFGARAGFRHRRFDEIADILGDAGLAEVSGALFDLGVSSPQLDEPDRGFAYGHDGPLDMRMDTTAERTASTVVNEYDERELATVLRRYGDERYARRIAAAIVAARPLASTVELADTVASAIPAPARRRGGHPAKRTFQAVRIEVNSELDALPAALDAAIAATRPHGRIAVLSYHSGEDRITKERFRVAAGGDCQCPPGLPCACGALELVRPVRKIRRSPSAAEVARNHRASSARLRIVERTAAHPDYKDPGN